MDTDPVRSPSSIPIPDDVVQILVDVLLDVPERDRPHPETAREIARGTLSQQLPKLYAHWAEGRVEAVARALSHFSASAWNALSEDHREHYRARARRLLGLPSEGKD